MQEIQETQVQPLGWENQLFPTLCGPMDYIVHGILQAGILEKVAIPSSRGSSEPRAQTQVLLHCRRILDHLNPREAQEDWHG